MNFFSRNDEHHREESEKVTQIFKISTEYWQIYFLAKHTIIFSQEADLRIFCADLENSWFSLSSRCKLFEVILMGIQLKKEREKKRKSEKGLNIAQILTKVRKEINYR